MAEAAKNTRAHVKRPTIAFFVSEFEGDYCEELCKGIIDAAEDHDVNLIIFPGRRIRPNEFNNNIIYEYVNAGAPDANVDALVISSLVLSGYISRHEFETFVLRYKPLPIISIGTPIEGVPSVLIDNRPGFKQLLNHLIKDHGKRRIAFIKGIEGHVDAGQRFSVYREVLRENGLEYDPDLVAPGDFTMDSGLNAMKILDERKVNYDAIAVASDIMAFGVLKALRERNITVPDQVAVTGFDNCEGAKHSSPTLTTVKQPIYEQSKRALEMALELIHGNQPDNVVVDTEMVIRESCGCFSETLQSFDAQPLDFKLNGLILGNVKLDDNGARARIDNFIDENLEKITGHAVNHSSVKTLITSCFQLFARDELGLLEEEDLFRGFQSLIDVSDLDENDLLTIQKAITTLNQWMDTIPENARTPARNSLLMDDFLQKLRVFITDLAIKMQGPQLFSYQLEIYQLRDILVEMVLKIHDHREQLHSIIPRLRSMGINNCYLYLYDKPTRYNQNDVWRKSSMVNLVIGYNDENWILDEDDLQLPWEKVIHHDFLPQKRYTLLLKPLFVEEERLGLILMEFNRAHTYLYESLTIEMSCALRLALLFSERQQIDNRLQEVVRELEDYNRKLKNISLTDELTGLYNRRGFFNLAAQSLEQARKEGKSGLVFFADMDGLKKINDQYGHDEGDLAIRSMAKILIKTFFALDIISRFGGDEFAIFTVGTDLQLLTKIKDRLLTHIEEYNLQSGKPYQVSITMGVVPFDSTGNTALENLLSQADKLLYEQKNRKKKVD